MNEIGPVGHPPRRKPPLVLASMGGAFGDICTSPAFEAIVLPLAAAILIALYAVQRRGTLAMGKVFGPVILVLCVVLVVQTSQDERGQVYLPSINMLLMVLVLVLRLFTFQSSSGLSAAYGISVTGTMLIDSILLSIVMLGLWHWIRVAVVVVTRVFLLLEGACFSSNLLRLFDGGGVSSCTDRCYRVRIHHNMVAGVGARCTTSSKGNA